MTITLLYSNLTHALHIQLVLALETDIADHNVHILTPKASEQSCAPISPSPNHPLRFPFPDELLCTESEVFDLLATLDTTTANSQDGISARMLK